MELGDWGSEKIRYYRYESARKTIERAHEISQKKGLKPKQLPIKFLYPFFEKSSLEDPKDAEMHDLWANLLAVSADKFVNSDIYLIDLISKLTSSEAVVMQIIWSANKNELSYSNSVGNYYMHRTIIDKRFEIIVEAKIQNNPTYLDHMNLQTIMVDMRGIFGPVVKCIGVVPPAGQSVEFSSYNIFPIEISSGFNSNDTKKSSEILKNLRTQNQSIYQ